MSNNLNFKIQEFFKTFTFFENKKNLFNSKMITNIGIDNGNVQILIEFEQTHKEFIEKIKSKIENDLKNISEIKSIKVIATIHKSIDKKKSTLEDPSISNISKIKNIIAIASGKGGVGKSTTSINVAISLKNLGFKVGILDADIYGPSLPKLIGSNKKPKTDGKNLYPITIFGLNAMSIGFMVPEESPTIWRGPMVIGALSQMLTQVVWGDIDYLVIDLPPGTGDIQLSLSQKASLTGAIIVSTPQDLALIDARKGLNMFRKVDVPVLGIIENMSHFSCPHCGEVSHIFSKGGAEKEAERLGVDFLGSIPLDIGIREGSDLGKPIAEYLPQNELSSIYASISKKINLSINNIKKSNPNIIIE